MQDMFRYSMVQKVGISYSSSLMIIAILLIVIIASLYFTFNLVFDSIFTRKEQERKNALKRFADELSRMTSVDEILQSMSNTVQESIDIQRLFVLIRGMDGTYRPPVCLAERTQRLSRFH